MTVLLNESEENLRRMIEELIRESKSRKLLKVMFSNQLGGQQIIIGNEALETMEEYIYFRKKFVQT